MNIVDEVKTDDANPENLRRLLKIGNDLLNRPISMVHRDTGLPDTLDMLTKNRDAVVKIVHASIRYHEQVK